MTPQQRLQLKYFTNGPKRMRDSLKRFVLRDIPLTILAVIIGCYLLTSYVHPVIALLVAGAVVVFVLLMFKRK